MKDMLDKILQIEKKYKELGETLSKPEVIQDYNRFRDLSKQRKSMEETVPKVRGAAHVEIVGLMVSLNRNEKGKGNKTALTEVSELYGFPTAAIVSMPEVVEYLESKNALDPEIKTRIDAYYAEYGATE